MEKLGVLAKLIEEELKPYVKKIDVDAFYAESFLRKLGESGLFSPNGRTQSEILLDELFIVKETAKTCMTTAFCLWCHLAALTYIRNTGNEQLKVDVLENLENGTILGGTGLSNPMKYYAGLEKLHLKAERTTGGYLISGVLPAVSNLGDNHSFGLIAGLSDTERVMCFVSCSMDGISMKERKDYLGLNGSATYVCTFKQVFVPDERIISEDADSFVEKVRPMFIAYQIPLGFGVTDASIHSIEKVCNKQNGCNEYLQTQPKNLKETQEKIEVELQNLIQSDKFDWQALAKIRLATTYLTLDAVQAAMLHQGSAAYIKVSSPARRLREAYFFANLTPTVKHLEKILS